ncbi:UNVERIFIED_CONTAM: hypothetical protein Sangu_2120900 [Sesamum angustifolium]|uniref:Uncharacterized protein n=1 Tax=Sesamum angustifolium TaxID=2727405 RepID=A0AAW2LH53_9LAMI
MPIRKKFKGCPLPLHVGRKKPGTPLASLAGCPSSVTCTPGTPAKRSQRRPVPNHGSALRRA